MSKRFILRSATPECVLLVLLAFLLAACSEQADEQIRVSTGEDGAYFEVPRESLPEEIDGDDIRIRKMSEREVADVLQSIGIDESEVASATAYDLGPDGIEFAEAGQLVIPFDENLPFIIHIHGDEAEWVQNVSYELSSSGNRAVVPVSSFSKYVSVYWPLGLQGPFWIHATASDASAGESVDVAYYIAKDPIPDTTLRHGNGFVEQIYLWDLPAKLLRTELKGTGAATGKRRWEDQEFDSVVKLESSDIACKEEGRGWADLETDIEFVATREGTRKMISREYFVVDRKVSEDGSTRTTLLPVSEKVVEEQPSPVPDTFTVKTKISVSFECLPEEEDPEKQGSTPARNDAPQDQPPAGSDKMVTLDVIQQTISARVFSQPQNGRVIDDFSELHAFSYVPAAGIEEGRTTTVSHGEENVVFDRLDGSAWATGNAKTIVTRSKGGDLTNPRASALAVISTKVEQNPESFQASADIEIAAQTVQGGDLRANAQAGGSFMMQVTVHRPSRVSIDNCGIFDLSEFEFFDDFSTSGDDCSFFVSGVSAIDYLRTRGLAQIKAESTRPSEDMLSGIDIPPTNNVVFSTAGGIIAAHELIAPVDPIRTSFTITITPTGAGKTD